MPTRRFSYLKYLVTGIFILFFFLFIYRYRLEFYVLKDIRLDQFIFLLGLALATIGLNGFKLRLIVRSYGIDLKIREWFGLASISLSLNSFLFKSGSAATSNYLKRRHGYSYMDFVGTLGGDVLTMIFVNSCLGFMVCGYLIFFEGAEATLLMAGWGVAIAGFFFLQQNSSKISLDKYAYLEPIIRALGAFQKLLANWKLFRNLAVCGLTLALVTSVRLYISARVVHLDIPWSHCLLFTAAMAVVRHVPMVQSDLGTREFAVGLLSSYLGGSLKQGFLAAATDRIIVLFWCLVCAGIFKGLLAERDPEPPRPEAS